MGNLCQFPIVSSLMCILFLNMLIITYFSPLNSFLHSKDSLIISFPHFCLLLSSSLFLLCIQNQAPFYRVQYYPLCLPSSISFHFFPLGPHFLFSGCSQYLFVFPWSLATLMSQFSKDTSQMLTCECPWMHINITPVPFVGTFMQNTSIIQNTVLTSIGISC